MRQRLVQVCILEVNEIRTARCCFCVADGQTGRYGRHVRLSFCFLESVQNSELYVNAKQTCEPTLTLRLTNTGIDPAACHVVLLGG
jgi:hypothetical protein